MPRLSPRSWPAYVWMLLPLAIGLLYAAGHAMFAPQPTIANLPPSDAILVHRIRGLEMLDITSPGPRVQNGRAVRAPREALGLERNNPNLIGVDHTAWIHLVLLPRTLRQDSTMAIFRTSDADAFEREFMRTDFIERGLIRHAQHLKLKGGWAAVGPSRDKTRRLGTGGITCADLGEDWSMAARMPELIDHALQLAKHYPWRDVLSGLGVGVEAARTVLNPKSKEVVAFLPGDGRVRSMRAAWKTARLWAWHTEGRLRLELEPQAGTAIAQYVAALGAPAPTAVPAPPPKSQAWLHVPEAVGRVLLAHVLKACGVRFVPEKEGVDAHGGLASDAEGGVLVWGEKGVGTGYAMTVGVATQAGKLPDLTAFLPLPASGQTSTELPEGAAPITVGDTVTPRKVPAGTVELRTNATGHDVLTFGPSAKAAAEAFVSASAANTLAFPEAKDPWAGDPAKGRVIARFYLDPLRAQVVLGRALAPGGMLAMLEGGAIHGEVLVADGRIRLHAWVVK